MLKIFTIPFKLFCLTSSLVMAAAEHATELTQETDPRAFKLLKEKSIDPQNGITKNS